MTGRRQAAGGRHAGAAPVFADLSGRRLRRMRLAGMAATGVLLACLAVMAVGLLGGPGASFMPWATHRAPGTAAGPGTAGSARPGTPAASPAPAPGVPQPRASASAGHSAAAATATSVPVSPSPLVTNAVGKAPPGRNRAPSPRPSLKHSGAA